MRGVAYLYTPSLDRAQLLALLSAFEASGVHITHLGKSDPARQWAGSAGDALALIATGPDLTNSTFGRDRTKKLHFTIDLHKDPRWKHDEISLSAPSETDLRNIIRFLAREMRHYLAILGTSGLGKDQPWEVLFKTDDCPSCLLDNLTRT
jgi:hypothetical protein